MWQSPSLEIYPLNSTQVHITKFSLSKSNIDIHDSDRGRGGEGEFSNLKLSQKQFHSLKEKDVVKEGDRGSKLSFAFSFGLILVLPPLPLPHRVFILCEITKTQISQQLKHAS